MRNNDLHLHVPAEIVGLPDLTIGERVLLSHVNEFPGCSNADLAKLLGISLRGAEQMLRRLRQRDLIQQIGKGCARQHRLKFYVEHHTKCGQNAGDKSHTKGGEIEIAEPHVTCGPGTSPDRDQPVPVPTQAPTGTIPRLRMEVAPDAFPVRKDGCR